MSGKSTVHESARALAADELSFTVVDDVHQIAERVEALRMSLQGRFTSEATLDDLQVSVLEEFSNASLLPSMVPQALSGRLF